MTATEIQSATHLVIESIVYIICIIINVTILKKEITKRNQLTRKVITTPFSRYSSLFCIISGNIICIFWLVSPIQGFCYFCHLIAHGFVWIQLVSMGFYQLSRLYYCYSNDKIHSKKGYPKWIFILMIGMGIFICINGILSSVYTHHTSMLRTNCGINTKLQFYYIDADPELPGYYTGFIWFAFTGKKYLNFPDFFAQELSAIRGAMNMYCFCIIYLFLLRMVVLGLGFYDFDVICMENTII